MIRHSQHPVGLVWRRSAKKLRRVRTSVPAIQLDNKVFPSPMVTEDTPESTLPGWESKMGAESVFGLSLRLSFPSAKRG
jgi:hypothetical protein